MEAFRFFPDDNTIVEYNLKNMHKTLRRIFEGKTLVFSQYEEVKLASLNIEIEKYNKSNPKEKLIIPENYNLSEQRRFLQATGFHFGKTILLLKENIKWRKELLPPKVNDKVIEILNSGFMYVHGRDNNYRPIFVLDAETYIKKKGDYTFDEWLKSVIFFMEYIVNNLLIPGQVENWNIITNVTGVSLLFLPGDLKKLMNVMQSNYRCRLHVNYIVGMSGFLRGIWSVIKTMLDDTTVRKIRILNDSDLSEVFTLINEEQVEKKFGGKAQNLIVGRDSFFPPHMPSLNYLKSDQVKEDVLVSEEEYKQMHSKGMLTVTSELYINKWNQENRVEMDLIIEEKQKTNLNEIRLDYLNEFEAVYEERTNSKRLRMKNIGFTFVKVFSKFKLEDNTERRDKPNIYLKSPEISI